MDGKGLRDYISEHSKEREAIRVELVGLMGTVSYPGEIVLDAMEGFYVSNNCKGDRDTELYRLRKSCLDILEVLSEVKPRPKLSDEVRIKARNLALDWKEKVSLNGDSPLEALGFLNLIVGFELNDVFDVSEHYLLLRIPLHSPVLLKNAQMALRKSFGTSFSSNAITSG